METNLFERLIHASLNTNTITYNSLTAAPEQAWYSFIQVEKPR